MLPQILSIGSMLGGILGGAGKSQAQERQSQNDFLQRENMLQANLFGTKQNALTQLLGLQERGIQDRAQMGIAAPQARMRQALLASLLQNAQPARISGLPPGVRMPQMSGGLTPASINPAARAGAGELQRQALLALLTKSDVPAATDYGKTGLMESPAMNPYKKAGKFESFLSGAGLIGSLLGGLKGMGVGQSGPSAATKSAAAPWASPGDWR